MRKIIFLIGLVGFISTGCATNEGNNDSKYNINNLNTRENDTIKDNIDNVDGTNTQRAMYGQGNIIKNYSYDEMNDIYLSHSKNIQIVQAFFEDEIYVRDVIKVDDYFYYYAVEEEWGIYRCNSDGSEPTLIGNIPIGPNEWVVATQEGNDILFITKDLLEATDGPRPAEPQSEQYILIDGQIKKQIEREEK